MADRQHEYVIRALIVVAIAVGASGLVVSCDITRPETHLIPIGYKGDVYILTGYRSGVPPRREALSMVFQIPWSGVLVTQDQPSSGWHTTKYFYVDVSGKRTPLRYEPSTIADTVQNRTDLTGIVWFVRRGDIQSSDLPCRIRFEQYYVGTPAHLLSRSKEEANAQEVRLEAMVRRDRLCP